MRVSRAVSISILAMFALRVAVLPSLHLLEHASDKRCEACEWHEAGPTMAADCSNEGPCGDTTHHHHRHRHEHPLGITCENCSKLLKTDGCSSGGSVALSPLEEETSAAPFIAVALRLLLDGDLTARSPPA